MGDLGLCPGKPNEVDSCMCVVVCGDGCLLWVAAEFCPPQAACLVHPAAIQGVATGNHNAAVSKLRGVWSSMHARGQQDDFQYDAGLDNGRCHRRRRRGPEWGGDSDLQPHNDVNKPAAGARGIAGACMCVGACLQLTGGWGCVAGAKLGGMRVGNEASRCVGNFVKIWDVAAVGAVPPVVQCEGVDSHCGDPCCVLDECRWRRVSVLEFQRCTP